MPVTINPCLQIIFIKIYRFRFSTIDKLISFCENVMIEYINRSSRFHMFKIIFHPSTDIVFGISRPIISSRHRCNDIMYIIYIERIINRSINIFKQFLSIFSFYQIMIPDAIINRNIHVPCIYQFYMRLQTILITDITGMYYERNLFICSIPMKIFRPIFITLHLRNFSISYLNKTMSSFIVYTDSIWNNTKIITYRRIINLTIMIAYGFISRRYRYKNESLLFVSRQNKLSIRRCFYNIQSIRNFNPLQKFFSGIINTIIIFVNKNLSGILSISR